MNPTIAQQLVKYHQADLLAEADAARLAASAKAAGKASSGKATGTWRLTAAFAGIIAALAH